MNAAQKSLEARPLPAPESGHPVDVDIVLAPDPASVTVVGSAPPHSSPPHPSSTLLLLASESIEVGASPNRLEESFDSDDFFLLADSILHNRGNVQAIAVRELAPDEIPSDSPLRYRLISGARRLRACKMHQLPVLAIVQKVQPTRELIDRLLENHLRQPLSPYELGMQLQHILASSESVSRRELARLVGLDVSVVQKAIDIAALPASVIAAFSSASEIQYRDAKPLKDAIAQSRDSVITCAESIKGQEISAKEVIGKLIEAAETAALANGQTPGVEPFNTPARPSGTSPSTKKACLKSSLHCHSTPDSKPTWRN